MPTKTTLRVLLIADIVICIASMIASPIGESSLPEAAKTYEYAPIVNTPLWISLATLWVNLAKLAFVIFLGLAPWVVWIGLFVFWPPARRLYLATTVLGILATPWFGPYIENGWGDALGQASNLLTGVILSVIYWSPLKGLFEPTPTPPMPSTQ